MKYQHKIIEALKILAEKENQNKEDIDSKDLLRAIIEVAKEANFSTPEKSYWECNNFSTAVALLAKDLGIEVELYSVPMRFERDIGEMKKGDIENHVYFKLGSQYYDFTLSQFGIDNKAYVIRTSPYPKSKKNPRMSDRDGYIFWYDQIYKSLTEITKRSAK